MSKHTRANFGLLILVSSFCLLLAEATCRFVLYRDTPSAMIFEDDIIYRYAPNSEVLGAPMNDIGCMGDDVTAAPEANEDRIFLLGGSTSFSKEYVAYVRHDVQKLRPHRKIKVVSCGRPRYTSYINLVNLRDHLLAFHPTAIVLYLGINDNIYNSFPWLTDKPSVGFFNWRSTTQLISFELLRYYIFEKSLWSNPNFGAANLRSSAIFKKNIEEIIRLAETNNIKVVLATFEVAMPTSDKELEQTIRKNEPTMEHFWGKIDSTVIGVNAHNAILRELAKNHSVSLAETSDVVPRDSGHYMDICHLTPAGYEILGQKIGEAVSTTLSN